MTTATDILAQLEELWENAEPGPTREGDAIIFRYGEGDFAIEPSADRARDSQDHIRILERAKPEAPEWEAVVASCVHDGEHRRQVFARTEGGGWESISYYTFDEDLVDPVPLVELPERDELREAVRAVTGSYEFSSWDIADAVLELLRGGRTA